MRFSAHREASSACPCFRKEALPLRRSSGSFRLLLLCAALCGAFFLPGVAYAEPIDVEAPEIHAASAILIDADTGEILFGKSENVSREPAGLVKIMTALLAIEALSADEILTVDQEVYAITGRQIFLQTGEQLTAKDLLYATLLYSANDAAVCLTKGVSGSAGEFVSLMNARARALGCTGTNFENPTGLSAEGQKSTAHDLALIAQEAMKNERFLEIVGAQYHKISATNRYEERAFYTTNLLQPSAWDADEGDETGVWPQPLPGEENPLRYQGTTGIKTGRTEASGACLAASASRDGKSYITVLLGAEPGTRDEYVDAIALFEYAFARAEKLRLEHEKIEEAAPVIVQEVVPKKGFFETIGLHRPESFSGYVKLGTAVVMLLVVILLVTLIRHRYVRDPYVRRARYGRVTREIKRVRKLK